MQATESLKAQQSHETREAILRAALTLFSRNGFAGTSMEDLARAAGITKGAVYWHFKAKDDLFQAILERIRTRWQEAVMRHANAGQSASERLEHLFAGYIELFTECPERCLFLQRILLDQDAVFAPQVARVFRQTAQFIARILDDGKAEGEIRGDMTSIVIAHGILGSLSGATQQSLANRSLGLAALIEEVKTATLGRVAAR